MVGHNGYSVAELHFLWLHAVIETYVSLVCRLCWLGRHAAVFIDLPPPVCLSLGARGPPRVSRFGGGLPASVN